MEKKIKIRESNFELLRIIAMILIVLHHFYYNNIIIDYVHITRNEMISQIISAGGKIGVNLFVLISGYFLINSKFNIKKLIKLFGETWFYSVAIALIAILGLKIQIGIKELLQVIFPITYNQYWFITAYAVMYIFSDYINKFLKLLSKKEYDKLLIMLIVIFSILPSIMGAKFLASDLGWLIILYAIGAYINLFYKEKNKNKIKIFCTCILSVVGILSILILDKLNNIINIEPLRFALPMNQIVPLGISIMIFLIFKNINIGEKKIINRIASCTFGVYLIHQQILIKNFIWQDIFRVSEIINSKLGVLKEFGIVLLVFGICCIIDLIRQLTIEKYFLKLIEKIIKKKEKIIKKEIITDK